MSHAPYALLAGLALLSASAFMSYTVVSRRLPFGLIAWVRAASPDGSGSIILGETIPPEQWLAYVPI